MNRPASLLNSIVVSIVTLTCGLLLSIFITSPHLLDASSTGPQSSAGLSNNTGILPLPRIYDIDFKIDVVYSGLNFPSSFTFLGPDDIIVLEKNTGQVRRILNGTLLPDPLLSVNVSNQSESGMLGIALDKKNSTTEVPTQATDVFLYFTESAALERDKQTFGNHVYKYRLTENKLSNPLRLVDLPSLPGPAHNGGDIIIGPDDNLYFAVGNLNVNEKKPFLTKAENLEYGRDPDGRAGILRITQDGQSVSNGSVIGNQYPLNLYYAYGIRNSFGIDFDPVTGNLWDTENGAECCDEINLVEPGFNSGWKRIQGIWENDRGHIGAVVNKLQEREMLVDFKGQGKYSDPEFTWANAVGPTALKFLNSDKLGKEYENDIFVGDFHKGNIYHFDLTKNRTALDLDGPLKDNVANNDEELKEALFGQGFGAITDLEIGPDGYLYILSEYQNGNECTYDMQDSCVSYDPTNQGTIFRIVPSTVVDTPIN